VTVRNTLLVARAWPPSEAYCAAVRSLGLAIWHRSMLVIENAERSVLLLQLAKLGSAKTPSTLVFSSPFAARALQTLAPELLSRHPLLSVGAGTSAALMPHFATAPSAGEGAQALLNMLPESLTGQAFCLLQAPDALPVLQDGLRARGAQVQIIEAYARIRAPIRDVERERLLTLRCVDVGSGEQLKALLAGGLPLATPLILPSERVRQLAESFGFCAPLRASSSAESERLYNLAEMLVDSNSAFLLHRTAENE